MRISLEMDEKRAAVLMRALEIMGRIGMGQFKDMCELMNPDLSGDELRTIEVGLKEQLKLNLDANTYNSASSRKVPEESQVAWDCYQWIRREISWAGKGLDWRKDEKIEGMVGVFYDAPFKVSHIEGDFNTERLP